MDGGFVYPCQHHPQRRCEGGFIGHEDVTLESALDASQNVGGRDRIRPRLHRPVRLRGIVGAAAAKPASLLDCRP